ncbi:MAG: bifunctional riboflavin kinase/FAD synthetase [Cyanobacteria bacterium J06597_1]
MHVVRNLADVRCPAAVALGNFDGVHRGHQQVIAPVVSSARGISTILTFDPHPRQVLSGQALPTLTPLPERLQLFESYGIEQVVLLPFTPEFAAQSPADFIATVLETGLETCAVSVGWDFCFGYRRSGNAQTLQDWGKRMGVPVHSVSAVELGGLRVSSSRIRDALTTGDVELAATLLGRPYRLSGPVVTGDQRGRLLGFPTANVEVSETKVLPQFGVYCGWACWENSQEGDRQSSSPQPAVLNIGKRPTFDGERRSIEVHLLDWSGDLYGQHFTVELHKFLRPEMKFESLEHLKAQLAKDCQQAKTELAVASSDTTPSTLSAQN